MSNPLYHLDHAARKDPLVFGISHVDLLESKQWEVDTRRWMIEPFRAVNPYDIERNPIGKARRQVVIKPTQVGISTMMMVKLLHFMSYWSVRTMYTLPRIKDVSDFTATRLEPMVNNSEFLRAKLGEPNSVHTKRIGNSYLFIMEASVEPRSMPADALYIDEVDLSDPANLSTAINRLDASQWKLNYFFSTPTLPGWGVHAIYESSDRRQWFVKCPACNHHQVLDWEKHLRIDGPPDNPREVTLVCEKCAHPYSLAEIQTGQWVAEFPSRSEDTIGFHISQMLTHPAMALYKNFIDPQTRIEEFYRKRLGKPYEMGGGSIDRADLLAHCYTEPYQVESQHDGSSTYYLGADQGNELSVVILKLTKGSKKPLIVWSEVIPFKQGFGRIAELMHIFRIKRAVIDGDPNRHSVNELQKKFPARVLMADYAEIDRRYRTKRKDNKGPITHVVINRTEGFDNLMNTIRRDGWGLPGNPEQPPQAIEFLINHLTNLRRSVELRRTPSGEKEVGVWRHVGPDHLGHAWLYAQVAMESMTGSGVRIAVVGVDSPAPTVEDAAEKPPASDLQSIVALLAEVPVQQLKDYSSNREKPGYRMPFPLSHKLPRALAAHDAKHIFWVIDHLLSVD